MEHPIAERSLVHSIVEPDAPLVELPAELRNEIYAAAMLSDRKIRLTVGKPLHRGLFEPSILRTCRQIRNEAIGLFYGTITFNVPVMILACPFLQRLDETALSLIRTLKLGLDLGRPFSLRSEWLESACKSANRIGMRFGPRGLRSDAILVPTARSPCEGKDIHGPPDEVIWTRLNEIEEFIVLPVQPDGGWCVEWKE